MRVIFTVARKSHRQKGNNFKRIEVGAICEYGHQNHPKSFSPTNFFALLFYTRDIVAAPTMFSVMYLSFILCHF